jgi:16S rRNA (cytosine1402-N4)-methyltransferase
LAITPDGTYVDVTFGGGGHSRAILEKLSDKGRLIAFDMDDQAKANLPDDPRIILVQNNYRHLTRYLRLHKALPVDGILADFGISSHQIDTAERGFSIRFEGKLDMRMNMNAPLSAFDVVNHYPVEKLLKVLAVYGEVPNPKQLAVAIDRERKERPIETTDQLTAIARQWVRGKENKYLAQVFQAIRIEVNDELKAIEEFLTQSTEVLRPGGRLVIMSYHSLEDRLVKMFMRYGNFEGEPEKDLYGRYETPMKPITKKPVEASEEEQELNPRSRSARLRIAENK